MLRPKLTRALACLGFDLSFTPPLYQAAALRPSASSSSFFTFSLLLLSSTVSRATSFEKSDTDGNFRSEISIRKKKLRKKCFHVIEEDDEVSKKMASSATQNASRRESHSYSSSSRSVGRRRASASLLSAFSLPSRSFSKARQQANACFTFPNILGRRRRSDTVVVAAGGERGSADSLFDMPGFSDVSSLSLSLSLSRSLN